MAELAVDLPVPVVSKVLGVCTATAEHWAHSQGFSPNYAAHLSRRPSPG